MKNFYGWWFDTNSFSGMFRCTVSVLALWVLVLFAL